MAKTYKNCQSCGMPLKRDDKGGGTHLDGSKSDRFCSHCFQNGAYTLPNLTAAEMQARVQDKITEMGFPRFLARLMARSVPKLERWR